MPRPRSSALAQAREAFDSGDLQRARVLAQEAVRASDTTSERAAESARPRSEGSSRAEARRILALALLYDDRGDEAERRRAHRRHGPLRLRVAPVAPR